jgi:L-asparaginase
METKADHIIVTHGTDTIIETAQFIESGLKKNLKNGSKMIILTGSFLPEKFKNSDADFNVGLAIGALQVLPQKEGQSSVLLAMSGLLIPPFLATRKEDGHFGFKHLTRFT